MIKVDSLDNIDLLDDERATPIDKIPVNASAGNNFRVEISNEKAHQEVERMRHETNQGTSENLLTENGTVSGNDLGGPP